LSSKYCGPFLNNAIANVPVCGKSAPTDIT
jgi:hypothetical protein